MAADAVAKVSKPQMRGLLHASIKRNISIGLVLSVISGVAFYFTVSEPRKRRYAEFYKNYDPEEDFKHMVKLGADFQSLQK